MEKAANKHKNTVNVIPQDHMFEIVLTEAFLRLYFQRFLESL